MESPKEMATAEKIPFRVRRWWRHFEAAEIHFDVNRYLLAAVVDRESLGGEALRPPGPHGYGDGGHGLGLAQIDTRHHPGFVIAELPDGTPLWQVPAFNIDYAAWFLGGNIRTYGVLVGVAGYNADLERCGRAVEGVMGRAQQIAALDACTTHHDYLSDVLRRCLKFGGPDYFNEGGVCG